MLFRKHCREQAQRVCDFLQLRSPHCLHQSLVLVCWNGDPAFSSSSQTEPSDPNGFGRNGDLPKQDEVNLGDAEQKCLSAAWAELVPCVQGCRASTRGRSSPPCHSSLHFTTSTNVKTSFSPQKEHKHGSQCRLNAHVLLKHWRSLLIHGCCPECGEKHFPS